MKTIMINIEEDKEFIKLGVEFPDTGFDYESIFVLKFRPKLIEFLQQLPISKLIGYGQSNDQETAHKQAMIMADIVRSGREPKK